MTPALAVWRRELGASFSSPVAYVVIAVFAMLAATFALSNLFVRGVATVAPMFQSFPLVFLFVCPALAMRLISEERSSGTLQILMTLPLGSGHVVVGKFLAAWTLLGVALVATLPVVLAVATLGRLDHGAVLAGYLASLLLGASYLAVGTLASTLARNQVTAFVVSFVVLLGLWLAGQVVRVENLAHFAPQTHFFRLARGLVTPADVVYFASTTLFFLALSSAMLEAQRWR